jgi:hypothetical protein
MPADEYHVERDSKQRQGAALMSRTENHWHMQQ